MRAIAEAVYFLRDGTSDGSPFSYAGSLDDTTRQGAQPAVIFRSNRRRTFHILAPGAENDGRNPPRTDSRRILNLGVGASNLLHTEHGRTTPRLTVVNLTPHVPGAGDAHSNRRTNSASSTPTLSGRTEQSRSSISASPNAPESEALPSWSIRPATWRPIVTRGSKVHNA